MMRYIDMTGKVIMGEERFAFWDTVRDRFMDIAGDQSWTSVEDLEASLEHLPDSDDLRKRLVGLARGNGAREKDVP